MMEDILLKSLASAGVPIPPDVSSVENLTPETLVSICAHSIHVISNSSESVQFSLPESMADRFKVCSDLASSVKHLGYIGDMSFHKFLYPSEEDMYKLIRFLVGRLSESSQTSVLANGEDSDAEKTINIENAKSSSRNAVNEGQDFHTEVKGPTLRTEQDSFSIHFVEEDITTDVVNRGGNLETLRYGQQSMSHQEMSDKTQILQNQEPMISDEVTAKSLELLQLEEQHDLLKTALEMACDEQNPLDSYITKLNEQIDAKRHNLTELESKWKAILNSLEEKKRDLEEALYTKQPESRQKHQKWKKVEDDWVSVLSETKQREEELSNLLTDVEKLPKLATRRSYIDKIKEITKNSRKQDIDIERILKETRELQLESNMIQERLHRTYAVVDETLLREAKKAEVGEQAHNLLAAIHNSFEEISEKILATDRARREATDLETKLSGIAGGSLNIDQLQADLDAIKKENEYLQSRLGNP